MLEHVVEFVNKIISYGGFKRSEFSNKAYASLLTSVEEISKHDLVMISSLIKRYKNVRGKLIIDTTDNPKYGLKDVAIKMKNLSNGGYRKGFKIVLFLYKMEDKTIPLGFALIYKGSKKLEALVLKALSILRNTYKLKPQIVLADVGFSTQEIIKRLNNYGYGFVIKGKRTYSLDKKQIKKQIPRGYGSKIGKLNNGVKVNTIRRKNRVFITNRVSLTSEEVLQYYGERWKIEEVFRVLKSCMGLNRCQQHSIKAQALYTFGCLTAYSILETIKTSSIYQAFASVILGDIVIDNSIIERLFVMT
ncbi:MAG: transposase [bacterium]